MIREKAGQIEDVVEEIEETGESIYGQLFEDEVDELWEEIWQLPKWQRKSYTKIYRKQVDCWRKRIRLKLYPP